jgi:predicted TIM-barrel fold metal-dependent hydrolase
MRQLLTWFIAPALLAGGIAAADDSRQHIGKDAWSLPLFDAHVHYKEPAWEPYPPTTVLELMDKSGVAMALVSSTPDEGTIRLWEHAPERIVPELRPYHGRWGSSNWTEAPDMFDYLMRRLDAYPHSGIGEFHLHRVDPKDEALLRDIARTAVARDLFVHVHSGKAPVELLFGFAPDLKIIWAHAGMSEPATVVEAMMAAHPTLTADTSYRENDILRPDNTVDPDWRQVLERFSDRFMVGSDTWVNGQWERYAEIIEVNRQWLSRLPRPVAERIAYRNAERLFGRKVTGNLIGQR